MLWFCAIASQDDKLASCGLWMFEISTMPNFKTKVLWIFEALWLMQAINMTKRSAISLRLPKLVQADDSVESHDFFNFASQSSYKSEALSFTVVLSLPFCWISCAITSLGVRWISSGFIASLSQSLCFHSFSFFTVCGGLCFFGRSVWCLRRLHFQYGPGMNQKAGILTVECFVGSNQTPSSGHHKLDAIPGLLLR